MRSLVLILFLLIAVRDTTGQPDTVPRRRKYLVMGAITAAGAGSLVYLNRAWYAQYNTGEFHFFDDNSEWLQMDKAGHAYSSYQMSRLLSATYRSAGFGRRQALIAGTGTALGFLTGVEIMDGFSRGWGFSWGDEAADLLGATAFMTQEIAWGRQRVWIKFGYARSGLAKYNPALLGDSWSTRILKDYNAQTYWLSFNPMVVAGRDKAKVLPWLNLSIGYGAWGMLGGHENSIAVTDENGNVLNLERGRRYYLSLDVDFTRIRARRKWVRAVFSALNMVKVPFPALGFGGGRLSFQIL